MPGHREFSEPPQTGLVPATNPEYELPLNETQQLAWLIAGIFVILACIISTWQARQHAKYNLRPGLRKYVMRILFMVPVYGIDSWIALRFYTVSKYFSTIRECYEAFAVYTFFNFLIAYLQEETTDINKYLQTKPPTRPLIPFCCFPPYTMGAEFLFNMKVGIFQFVVLKVVNAVIAFILATKKLFSKGDFDPTESYLWLMMITNWSQLFALYFLIQFYQVTKDDMREIRPLPKFLAIKAVVFLTFWQGVVLAGLVNLKYIKQVAEYTAEDVATGFNDFFVCIEMFFAALWHLYAFPLSDFKRHPHSDEIEGEGDVIKSLKTAADVSDIADDFRELAKGAKGSLMKREPQIVETDEERGEGKDTDGESQLREIEEGTEEIVHKEDQAILP